MVRSARRPRLQGGDGNKLPGEGGGSELERGGDSLTPSSPSPQPRSVFSHLLSRDTLLLKGLFCLQSPATSSLDDAQGAMASHSPPSRPPKSGCLGEGPPVAATSQQDNLVSTRQRHDNVQEKLVSSQIPN